MESPPPPPPPLMSSTSYPLAMDPTALLPQDMIPTNTSVSSTSDLNSVQVYASVNRTGVASEPSTSAVKSEQVNKTVLVSKPKSLTKLPMPPGIDQNDLESIDSPPSKSPSPIPEKKTPPKKGIKDLPLPPGEIIGYFFPQ